MLGTILLYILWLNCVALALGAVLLHFLYHCISPIYLDLNHYKTILFEDAEGAAECGGTGSVDNTSQPSYVGMNLTLITNEVFKSKDDMIDWTKSVGMKQ